MTESEIKKYLLEQELFYSKALYSIKKAGGYYGGYKDKDTGKDYFYYIGMNRKGQCFVHLYDDYDKCCKFEDGGILDDINMFFSRIFDKLKDCRRKIKYFFQRAIKGYCDEDIFSIDHWFLKIIPKMLRELKEKPSFYPTDENGEVIKYPREYKIFGACENYRDLLEKMASNFEKARYYDDSCYSTEHNPYNYNIDKEKYDEWQKNFVEYKEKMKNEAFDLFVKNFNYINW